MVRSTARFSHACARRCLQCAQLDLHHICSADARLRIRCPAHFMHAEGNFQFWDPASGILFSGDLGVSLIAPGQSKQVITSLREWLPKMEPFHRRYMVSNKIPRYWARMVRDLPIRMIVPQHGIPLQGAAIGEFIDWVETLDCGIDLMTQQSYRLP